MVKQKKSIVLMARVLVLALLIGVFASVPSEQTFAAANKALRSKVVFNGDKESDASWMNNNYVMQAGYKKASKIKKNMKMSAKAYVPAAALKKNGDTVHVETVVLLSHKKPDGHINVKVEFGEGEGKVPLDNIAKRAEEYKPKERVTYKMIKEYIEAKYGFKVHTAYIAEVKRDLGLPMYDAPNAVEELKQPRKHPTAEKVEAIKDALKHFEVI